MVFHTFSAYGLLMTLFMDDPLKWLRTVICVHDPQRIFHLYCCYETTTGAVQGYWRIQWLGFDVFSVKESHAGVKSSPELVATNRQLLDILQSSDSNIVDESLSLESIRDFFLCLTVCNTVVIAHKHQDVLKPTGLELKIENNFNREDAVEPNLLKRLSDWNSPKQKLFLDQITRIRCRISSWIE